MRNEDENMWEQLGFRDIQVIIYACRTGYVKPYDLVKKLGFGVGSAYNTLRKLAVNGLLTKEDDRFVPTARAWRFLEDLQQEILVTLKQKHAVARG